MSKVRIEKRDNGLELLLFRCPGCGNVHQIYTQGQGVPVWSWNKDLESPTVKPSVRVNRGDLGTCHFFILNGHMLYCKDSTHELAGKTVPMEDFSW